MRTRRIVIPPAVVGIALLLVFGRQGLFAGLGARVRPGGVVALYGPFQRDGGHTAPSNAAFDADLKSRDPRWGVRALEDVTRVAEAHGFVQTRVVAMPAYNLTVVFVRG